ncbi:MAG: hypothetical protein OXC68_06405, partial [Aestuariivita sp.]|nr:hypothetical protein [Aestuariivita sp.]
LPPPDPNTTSMNRNPQTTPSAVVHFRVERTLSKENQMVILNAAAKAETRGWILSNDVQTELTANLGANGMTVDTPNEVLLAQLQEIGATMVQEWLDKAGEEGVIFFSAYQSLE